MGIYYLAPLLGPSIGPLFGGVLTTAFNWRAAFWFLVIVAGCSLVGFVLFFKDTYRMQRSMVYQNVLKHHLRDAAAKIDSASKIANNSSEPQQENRDIEKQTPLDTTVPAIKLSLKDVSPMKPLFQVLRRLNNLAILLSSGTISSICSLKRNIKQALPRSLLRVQFHCCIYHLKNSR
jgi:MFS family permease